MFSFRLLKDETVIGRNSMVVDCYINSSLHPKLISREHAIISQTRTENGMVELTIQDRSVNGTFVNDKKVTFPECFSNRLHLQPNVLSRLP